MTCAPRRRRSTTAVISAGLAALALTAAGCGSSGPDGAGASGSFAKQDGQTIVKAALADTLAVKVMRIRGKVRQDGKDMRIDVRNDAAGRCAGTISQGKGTARIVVTKDAAFINGDDTFWRDAAGANAAQLLATLDGRWLKSKPDPQISGLCGLGRGMVAEMKRSMSKDSSTTQVGKVTKVDGVDVVEVNDGGAHPEASVLISVDAPHYIRRIVSRIARNEGVLTLSGFGKKAPVRVPAAADVFSMQ